MVRIRLESTNVDPRIFDVLIDFTGYPTDKYWHKTKFGFQYTEVFTEVLDSFLEPLKINRISMWKPERPFRPKGGRYPRIDIYRTTVISDRDL